MRIKAKREIVKLALLFPGLWLCALIAACILRLQSLEACFVAGLLGVAGYVCRARAERHQTPAYGWPPSNASARSRGKLAPLAAVVVLPIISYFVVKSYYWTTWNPIGTAQDAGWGQLWPFEDDVSSSLLSSRGGIVVSMRQSTAKFFEVPSTVFIFVHSSNESDGARNLVFRYDDSGHSNGLGPRITWTGNDHMTIHVWPNSIGRITKKLTSIGDVEVAYDLGAVNYATQLNFWDRPYW